MRKGAENFLRAAALGSLQLSVAEQSFRFSSTEWGDASCCLRSFEGLLQEDREPVSSPVSCNELSTPNINHQRPMRTQLALALFARLKINSVRRTEFTWQEFPRHAFEDPMTFSVSVSHFYPFYQ